MKPKSKSRTPSGRKRSVGSVSTIVKAVMGCLCVWLVIQLQYFLHTYRPHENHFEGSHEHVVTQAGGKDSSSIAKDARLWKDAEPRVAILLQVSPVRAVRQISRLSAIDKGYASWTRQDEQGSRRKEPRVKIFAAVHNTTSLWSRSSLSPREVGFQNIRLVRTFGDNPFHKLLDAFVGVMCKDTSSEWVVMANDHSFFIPVNLQRYLRTLRSSDLVYGGNRLSLMVHEKLLFFASGGAGAIFSRATVNALLVLWSVLHPDYFLPLLTRSIPSAGAGAGAGAVDSEGGGGEAVGDIDLTTRGQDWLVVMRGLVKSFEKTNDIVQVTVKLSDHVSMRLSRTAGVDAGASVISVTTTTNTGVQPPEVVEFKLINTQNKFCSSNSKWALDNPGIIVAGCLQEVFKVHFTDAAVVKTVVHNASARAIVREELFNVYGPVRLTTSDIDDWYINMKNRVLRADVAASPSPLPLPSDNATHDDTVRYIPYTRQSLSAVAKHVVSFHYISEAESSLLFKIFSARSSKAKAKPKLNDGVSASGGGGGSDRDWLSAWPRGADVGDYARPLQSAHEAESLREFIAAIDIDTDIDLTPTSAS